LTQTGRGTRPAASRWSGHG